MLILLATLIVGVCAAAYAVLATLYYEVKSVLRPASLKDFDELNAFGGCSFSPAEVLRRIGGELVSYEKRLEFFQTNQKRFEAIRKDRQTIEQAFDDKDLSDWREEAARLRNLNIDFSHIGQVKIYQAAIDVQDLVKPKRLLVLAIGLVLGGMLGIFIALVRSMPHKSQPETA